ADNGKELAQEIFGDRFVWVPYVRPGFTLSKMIAEGVQNNPDADLVLMETHGLVVWGETAKEIYDKTISVINEAENYINGRLQEEAVFGGKKYDALA
ncbi:class II aldolase/adducin family protein, partial [Bacillus sp. SIMBA_161]